MTEARHPIECLPVELLSEIFEQSQWDMDTYSRWRRTRLISQTLRLSSVCRYWRAVALSTPRLWTNITLDLGRSKSSLDALWKTLRFRAATAAVDLTFKNMPTLSLLNRSQEMGGHLRTFDPTMILSISSLTYMATEGSSIATSLLLLGEFEFKHEQVSTLRIVGSNTSGGSVLDDEWDWIAFLTRFRGLRAIEVINESRFSFKEGPKTRFLPSIRSIKLDRIYTTTVGTILSICPNLEDVTVIACGDDGTVGSGTTIVANLVNLELKPIFSGLQLSALELPSLRSFKYHKTSRQVSAAHLEFIRRHPSITDLELVAFEESIILPIARVAPQVANLKLVYYSVFRDSDPSLPLDDDDTVIFPALRTLDIVCEVGHISVAAFETLVKERCLPSSHSQRGSNGQLMPLESLTIHSSGPWVDSALILDATRSFQHHVSKYSGKKMTLSWV